MVNTIVAWNRPFFGPNEAKTPEGTVSNEIEPPYQPTSSLVIRSRLVALSSASASTSRSLSLSLCLPFCFCKPLSELSGSSYLSTRVTTFNFRQPNQLIDFFCRLDFLCNETETASHTPPLTSASSDGNKMVDVFRPLFRTVEGTYAPVNEVPSFQARRETEARNLWRHTRLNLFV